MLQRAITTCYELKQQAGYSISSSSRLLVYVRCNRCHDLEDAQVIADGFGVERAVVLMDRDFFAEMHEQLRSSYEGK